METNYTRTKETQHTMTMKERNEQQKRNPIWQSQHSTQTGHTHTHDDKSMIEMDSTGEETETEKKTKFQ